MTSLWFMPTVTNSASLYLLKSSDYPSISDFLTTVVGGSSLPTSSTNPLGGGLSLLDRIALRVGIGVGLPATLATLIMCYYIIRGRG